MRQREGFPPGVPAWIERETHRPDAMAAFYGGLFGWEFQDAAPTAADARYLVATLDGNRVAAVSSQRPGSPAEPAWRTYVGVENVEAAADTVRTAGGSVLVEPHDAADNRAALCADPGRAVFGLWQPGAIPGADVVNAPGTWNFSELNTDDPDGAERFYAALFGWKADEIDMGALSGRMIQLPGYADFLEQFDPGIRQRHADFGAPPGFSDCVGWILPLDEGGSPHWSITFAVADADAIASKAEGLGASVAVQPFDLPPTRSAVLVDPDGARLTVSAFNPG
jgi:predicted enzyme related to lactoylglutathione lyase